MIDVGPEDPDFPVGDSLMGEGFGADMRPSFARYANRVIKALGGSSRVINLGAELGEVDADANKVRFRDALEEGHLRIYIRKQAGEHKVIISTVVALGVVAAGIYAIQHHKKSR